MNKWIRILLTICFLIIIYDINRNQHIENVNEQISTVYVPEEIVEEQPFEIPEYVAGVLRFPSGLLQLPFMYAQDNQFYLNHDIEGNYDSKGTVFMDYRDSLDQQGVLLYGHHVIYDKTAMFSPLLDLREQSAYEQHNTFELLTDTERRMYIITHVFVCNSYVQFDQTRSQFVSSEDFQHWIAYADENNLVISHEQLTQTDHFVILQTCVDWRGKDKLIVIGKLVIES